MATTTDTTELSACPQVRDACEECHSRKIKCQTTKAGACRACQNNGRLCFFLPRNKSGRPKGRDDGSKEEKRQNHAIGTTAAAAAAAMAEHAATVEAGGTPLSPPRGTNSSSSSSPKNLARPSIQHVNSSMASPHGMPRSMSDPMPGVPFPAFENMDWPNAIFQDSSAYSADMELDTTTFQHQDMPTVDGYFDIHRLNMGMAPSHSQHSHSASYPSYDSSGSLPSLPGSEFNFNQGGTTSFFPTPLTGMLPTPMFAPGEQKGPDGCFSSLLGHINRLQRCLEKVRSGKLFSHPHTRGNQLKIVISTIDSSCMATCNALKEQFQVVLGQRSEAKMNGMNPDMRAYNAIRPDQPLIALAITAIITIPRLCLALMRSELPDAQSSLDNMLLLNRLGCNILQTRIALVNIEKLDRGLAYLTEDAKREISIVQTEFDHMKKNGWSNTPVY
jgi:hypothetical protein